MGGKGRRFRSLHLVIKHKHKRYYFMRKYEDLYDFYITLEEKFASSSTPLRIMMSGQGLTGATNILMESICVPCDGVIL